jgi:hypothetical protein
LFVDVSKLTSLTIADAGASNELFAIGHAGSDDNSQSFSDFGSFASALASEPSGSKVIAISAAGQYNGSGTFTATRVLVLLGS